MMRNTIKNVVIAFLTTRWMMTWPIWLPDIFEVKIETMFFVITMTGIIYYCIRDFETWILNRNNKKDSKTYLSKKGDLNERESRYSNIRRIYDDRTF